MREKNKEFLTEKELLVQEKEKSETKLEEVIKEKMILYKETEQLASKIEQLKSDFTSLSVSKAELEDVHSCVSVMLDELQHKYEVTEKEKMELVQENESLHAEWKSLVIINEEILKEKEKLSKEYYKLHEKVVALLEQTDADFSCRLLVSEGKHELLLEEMSNLALKLREIERLQAQTFMQKFEVLTYINNQVWLY